MIKFEFAIFLYQKDFTERGHDRYFLFKDNVFEESDIEGISNYEGILVTHDYWLIAPSLYKQSNTLPKTVLDLTELARLLLGKKLTKETSSEVEISSLIKPNYNEKKDLTIYFEQYYRRNELDLDTYQLFAHHMTTLTEVLLDELSKKDELQRFFDVELPVFNLITKTVNKGVRIDQDKLRAHKKNINFDFFRVLKQFSIDFDLMFEVPTDSDVVEILQQKGFDTEDYSLDFILEFLPFTDDFSDRLIALKKLRKSRVALASMSASKSRVCPIAENHATVTSRIYYKKSNPTESIKKIQRYFYFRY